MSSRTMFAVLLLLIAILAWWVAYKFTIYALPCIVGVAAGTYAFETGAGWLGAIIVWAVTALTMFALMRSFYASAAGPLMRGLLAVAFVAPSGIVAYFLFDDLTAGQVPSETWRQVLCALGAGIATLIAFARLNEPPQE